MNAPEIRGLTARPLLGADSADDTRDSGGRAA
jgi:hypothetical protein